MAGWLARLFGARQASADEAKERLKLVLIHDRTDLPPESMERLKNDMIQVMSRYFDIDVEATHISLEHEGRVQRLVAEIPVKKRSRRRRSVPAGQ